MVLQAGNQERQRGSMANPAADLSESKPMKIFVLADVP
jgi:hypothetical protein